MTTVARPFRGVSADDRLRRRRDRLIDAGFAEIAEVGVAGLRMNSVCARAGLTQRYFYEHFANRDELLAVLWDALTDELIDRTVATVAAQSLDLFARAKAALTVFVETVVDDPRKARLFAEALSVATLAERKSAAVHRYAEFTANQAFIVHGEQDARTAEQVKLAALIVVGGQADTAVLWMRNQIALNRRDYIESMAHMFVDAVTGILERRPVRK